MSAFAPSGPWLFGKREDLAIFGGSAALALVLLAIGAALGWLERDLPDWAWLACVVGVDVAHVWSTAFRVYFDPQELRRRPILHFGAPLACWAAGAGLYAAFGAAGFWRAVAYLAVWHFVRQQYGWVALYRRRTGDKSSFDHVVDTITIYMATLWPLVHWHAHLPRRFAWMIQGDFVPIASWIADLTEPLYWAVLAIFVARQLWLWRLGRANAGKILVVLTTWLCWWLGIVALDGDYAFTVTNVLIHGIPYLALTFRWGRARSTPASLIAALLRGGVASFTFLLVAIAFAEEALWDRLVWHDRGWLFGETDDLGALALAVIVPLLATPQLTHYVLDAFVWKVRSGKNPELARALS